eukprot:TRINITY_DN38988_c0_g1_i2.p1 TRINITY_DN38988_c0_g1~~TRINITY_DN38988_c0_g1_i2.p1  ORF type:complete len:100 (+),score=13.95 TRINITY_DN38988_c0_g1_i2:134-433(+)
MGSVVQARQSGAAWSNKRLSWRTRELSGLSSLGREEARMVSLPLGCFVGSFEAGSGEFVVIVGCMEDDEISAAMLTHNADGEPASLEISTLRRQYGKDD